MFRIRIIGFKDICIPDNALSCKLVIKQQPFRL